MSKDLPCPVCGFLTCEDNYGNYSICDVCGWEDDGVQLANPCSGGGANGESLAEAQKEALIEFPLDITKTEGFSRGKNWRPLTDSEIQKYNLEKSNRHWSNKAVLYESETYWMKNS